MLYTNIVSVEPLKQHMNDPDWIIFDCRFSLDEPQKGYQEYQKSHIPGAYYAHLDDDLSSPQRADSGRHPLPEIGKFTQWLGHHGVGSDKQVVAYDDAGGAYAARLWWMLQWLGHEAAAVLDGGWQAWTSAEFPVDQSTRPLEANVFVPRPDRSRWLDVDQLVHAMNADSMLVVDARGPDRFTGKADPIDPVAGHMPGAVNLPFPGNLTKDQRFRSADELCARFQTLLADRPAETIVHSCGSGVTACHNLLAMEIAGLSGSKLYPGSWSEWITDPKRAVVTGPD